MAYIGATELTDILPQNITISASSTPLTLGEVATIAMEISAELDSAAGRGGYTVPVSTSAAEAYGLMQRWTKLGAGWQVLRIIFPNLGGPAAANSLADDYRDAYKAALAGLISGDMVLPGAPSDTSEQVRELPRSYYTSNRWATTGVLPHLDMDAAF